MPLRHHLSSDRTPLVARTSGAALMVVVAVGAAQVVDLNGNSRHDSEDIQLGVSDDCNRNGLVDERDAAAPHFSLAVEQINAVEQFQNNVWDARPIDFNHDGLMDLVVSSMTSTNLGGISLWRNEGGPGLVHVQRIPFPNARPYTLRVADFNGDGWSDVIASD
ncbi:MAG: VCBS repeat-containing protein, partial [Phycisphaerales bacterium]|nr:VCBS repeat-containing protein [Phycisphaerales bacterium]